MESTERDDRQKAQGHKTMTTPIMMAYPCPKCMAGQAILPPKSDAESIVQCAQCGRKHGRLDEIRKAFADQAREEGAQKARQIYGTRSRR
jgi:Zn ribbon nucleic-acid-binding protein